jgi:hypothetical protein
VFKLHKYLFLLSLISFFSYSAVSSNLENESEEEVSSVATRVNQHSVNSARRIKKLLDTWESCIFIGGIVVGSIAGGTGALYLTDQLISVVGFSSPLSPAATIILKAVSRPLIALTGSFLTSLGFLKLSNQGINFKKQVFKQDEEIREGVIVEASKIIARLGQRPKKPSKEECIQQLQEELRLSERDAETFYGQIIEGDEITLLSS